MILYRLHHFLKYQYTNILLNKLITQFKSTFFISVDYSYRVYTLNLVTQYFKAVTCFINYGLLPESIEEDPTETIIPCDFNSLIQYAIKRLVENLFKI